jgi:hypothetical protein
MSPRNAFRFGHACFALAVLAAFTVLPARAEDAKDSKDGKDAGKQSAAKVDGTWKWSFTTQNGEKRESTMKLTQDGEKVTGTVSGRQGNATEIKDGKLDADGNLSFSVTREFNGNSMTMKYNGKVDGDTIKGKIASTGRDGQSRERDWEATRQKDDAKEGDKSGGSESK